MKKLLIILFTTATVPCFAQKKKAIRLGEIVKCYDLQYYSDSMKVDINIDWIGKCARVVTQTMTTLPDTVYIRYDPDRDCPASKNINKERLARRRSKK